MPYSMGLAKFIFTQELFVLSMSVFSVLYITFYIFPNGSKKINLTQRIGLV